MKIQLSEHFTYRKLLRFVFPSIVMMIFTSVYGVVDGLFVSNFVGKMSFTAINLIWPFLMIVGCFGFMLGTGGSALVAKTLGEGDRDSANRYFTLLVYVTISLGVFLTVIGLIFLRPMSVFLGAKGEMVDLCVTYGSIILISQTAFMLQGLFQSFLVTAERPTWGLVVTVAAGLTNMLLDFVFIALFKWGIAGAALATAASQLVGGVAPLIYFICPNRSPLRMTRTRWYGRMVLNACINGSSELMTNISSSVVSMLYNIQLMKLCGEDGVAAYGVMMYVNFVFIAIFIGYSIGSAPIVGFHYGAGNDRELKNMFNKSVWLVGGAGVVMTVLAVVLSPILSNIFVGYDKALYDLTHRGFLLYSLSFLFAGVNIFGSSFFTALGNGPVSATISFLRTLVFQIAAVLLLPLCMGSDGIWLSIVIAELGAMLVTVMFFAAKRKKYRYI